MTEAGLPPGDIERIAAFLDRRLPEEERREFLDRLDSDEALYEVFVETVRYREDSAREESNVIEHPASKGWARWMGPAAIAAMLMLVIAGPLILGKVPREGEFAVALVRDEGLGDALGERWYEQGWTEFRGENPTRVDTEAAFRAGVRALELEVALRLGRQKQARELTAGLTRELDKIDLLYYPGMFDEMEGHLDHGSEDEALREFLNINSGIRSALGDASSSYAFGKWAETGRLAARSANESLLRTRSFREALQVARQEKWDAEIEEKLDVITGQIGRRGTTLDLVGLEGAFQGIIDSH